MVPFILGCDGNDIVTLLPSSLPVMLFSPDDDTAFIEFGARVSGAGLQSINGNITFMLIILVLGQVFHTRRRITGTSVMV